MDTHVARPVTARPAHAPEQAFYDSAMYLDPELLQEPH